MDEPTIDIDDTDGSYAAAVEAARLRDEAIAASGPTREEIEEASSWATP